MPRTLDGRRTEQDRDGGERHPPAYEPAGRQPGDRAAVGKLRDRGERGIGGQAGHGGDSLRARKGGN